MIDRLAIRRIAVNALSEADFPDLPGVGVAVPTWKDQAVWEARLVCAPDPHDVVEGTARAAARTEVDGLAAAGIGGMRVAAEPFEAAGKAAVGLMDAVPDTGLTAWQAGALISHILLRALSARRMFAQLFLGIERDVTPCTGNGCRCAAAHHGPCTHSSRTTVAGSNSSSVRLRTTSAQAARIYPNVHLGGLWWYNFRASTYIQTMQARVEAVRRHRRAPSLHPTPAASSGAMARSCW